VSNVPGETLDLGFLDRTMMALDVVHPLEGIVLELEMLGGGHLVERCFIYRDDDDRSRRRGAVGARRRSWLGGLAQGGGAV